MQDCRTGDMVEIPDEIIKSIPVDARPFEQRLREALAVKPEDIGIPPQSQGPIFTVGEEVQIKGGRFAVKSFGTKEIVFRGLPGTQIVTQ